MKFSRIISIIVCIAMVLCSTVLMSCANGGDKCEHIWEEYPGGKEPTCEKAGELLTKCALCGGIKVTPAPKVSCQYIITDEWTWSDSKSNAYMLGVCKFNVKHSKVFEGTITEGEKVSATCGKDGYKILIATLEHNGKTFKDEITVTVPATGNHTYVGGVCTVCQSPEA